MNPFSEQALAYVQKLDQQGRFVLINFLHRSPDLHSVSMAMGQRLMPWEYDLAVVALQTALIDTERWDYAA